VTAPQLGMTTKVFIDWIGENLGLDPAPKVDYGPQTDERVNDYPNAQIVIQRRPGPGLQLEGIYDRVMWGIDVAGDQMDPDSAETIALALDRLLVRVDASQDLWVDGGRVASIQRAGSGPAVAGIDDGDRWHLAWACIVTVESGL
jgi:hypothetical protein